MMKIDGKTAFALTLVIGFMILVAFLIFFEVPTPNEKTVDVAMASLGTAVGAAVMALLRNSRSDDIKAENVGKALDTIGNVALNTTPTTPSQ